MPSLPASATSSHLRTLLAQLEVDEAASRARRDGGGVILTKDWKTRKTGPLALVRHADRPF
jgi:hypothetical protein